MKNRTILATLVLLVSLVLLPIVASAQGQGNAYGRDGEQGNSASAPGQLRPVAAVPEPGAALLFGAGLLVASAVTRRRATD